MIVVTAGHVDHGKTSVLHALTGMNADRLPEEQQRGMTIELGYAFMNVGLKQPLAFVDVPGHSKFINTMLAGVSCAKHALLIVALDDGVMPQTREHLGILQLLNLDNLLVVLTKQDKVERARIVQVTQEVTQLLSQYQRASEILVVSAHTGFGIDALKHCIMQMAIEHYALLNQGINNRSFRLAIDRVFSVKGAGLVVTGTVISGQVQEGQSLYLSSQTKAVKVRGIRRQSQLANEAYVGERVALNLTGVDKHQGAKRGDWLTSQAPAFEPKHSVCGVIELHQPIKHWQQVQLHLAHNHTGARLGLLQQLSETQALVEMQCEQPLAMWVQDKLIVRDAAAKTTLGALRVLDIAPPTKAKRSQERLSLLAELIDCVEPANFLAVLTAQGCVKQSDFMWAHQLAETHLSLNGLNGLEVNALESTAMQSQLIEIEGYILSRVLIDKINSQLVALITAYHEQAPELLGLTVNRLQRMTHGQYPLAVLMRLCHDLCSVQILQNTRGLLHLPVHQLGLSAAEEQLWQQVKQQMLASGAPVWSTDIATAQNIGIDDARKLCRKLIQLGHISSLVKDRFMLTTHIYHYANIIRDHMNTYGEVTVINFNAEVKLGRKASIQVLEFYDRCGLTWRKKKDNSRVIRDAEIFINSAVVE